MHRDDGMAMVLYLPKSRTLSSLVDGELEACD